MSNSNEPYSSNARKIILQDQRKYFNRQKDDTKFKYC